MHKIFTSNEYNTPDDKHRNLGDMLVLNTRLYFVSRYVGIVLRSRKAALEGSYDREAWVESSIDVFRLIEDCGGKFHISGIDNIRRCEGPVVFVSNHMSTLETMVFPSIIASEKEATFVVKDSLVRHPFFGAIMQSRNPIVLGRENSREDLMAVLTKGQELLAAGTSVIIFPQSTRMVKFIPEKFNSLGVKLAANAKVQVVPAAIKTDFWEMGKYMKDLGPIRRKKQIHIVFGEPITVKGTGKQENAKIIEFVTSHLKGWGGEVA